MNLTQSLLSYFVEIARTGEQPLSELALANRFSVSRGKVREAMSYLVYQGLIERQQGKSTRLVNPLAISLSYLPVKTAPDLEQIRDVLELRAFLESCAASACARHATDEQLKQIEGEFLRMRLRNQGETTLVKAKADLRFHMLIATCSHNLVIRSLSELFYSRYFAAMYKALDLTLQRIGRYPDKISIQHGEIFLAIMNRDSERAGELACEHVLYTRSLLDTKLNH